MPSLKNQLRAALLRIRNLRKVRRFASDLPTGGLPIFILANPADVHFAPLAAAVRSDCHRQVFVGNGLSDADATWLQTRCPGIPVLRLSASLTGNAASYLAHGELVDLLALAFSEPFFIQDADCFVLDPGFFDRLRIPGEQEYAAGPFWKNCPEWDHILPDTFLVGVSPASLARIKKRYSVDAAIATSASPRASVRLKEAGFSPDWHPERSHDKNYFDTLQLSWILATLDGESFGKIEGGADSLHHVGGTSYLAAKPSNDLAHWDWWPLNTCYTTLRILEQPGWEPLRGRFAHLFERFGDAEQIEQDYPEFVNSTRFQTTARALKQLSNHPPKS